MPVHDMCKIGIMVLSLVTFTGMVAMNEGVEAGVFKGLFDTDPGNVSHRYETDLTPAPWTFKIWNIVYLWQFLWLGYILFRIFKRNELGWAYMQPDILPTSFYFVWILNNVTNVEWLFLRNAMHLIPAMLLLVLLTLTTYIALIISHQALYPHIAWLKKNSNRDLWLIRILVQNGIALYATWTTMVMLLDFTALSVYVGHVSSATATTISLCILFFGLLWWFYMENLVFDKYVRYNLTVYPAVILALANVLKKDPVSFSPNSISTLIVVLLVVTCGIGSIRLLLFVIRNEEETRDEPPPYAV